MPLGGNTQEEAYAYLDLFSRFRYALGQVERETNLSKKDILQLLKKSYDEFIPVSVFCTKKLSPLEAAVKFLHEEHKYTFAKIGRMLKRDSRTIWSTYNQAKKKCSCRMEPAETDYFIPITIFQDRKLAVLEALVSYLKDNFKLKYSQISRLIDRDQRTVWTVYRRASLK